MSRSNPEPEVSIAPLHGEEEHSFLCALAQEFIGMLEDTERAMAKKIEAQRFDQDEYLAFWSYLPAKVRTAIKRGSQ